MAWILLLGLDNFSYKVCQVPLAEKVKEEPKPKPTEKIPEAALDWAPRYFNCTA
jgi:hypothetical protein